MATKHTCARCGREVFTADDPPAGKELPTTWGYNPLGQPLCGPCIPVDRQYRTNATKKRPPL